MVGYVFERCPDLKGIKTEQGRTVRRKILLFERCPDLKGIKTLPTLLSALSPDLNVALI